MPLTETQAKAALEVLLNDYLKMTSDERAQTTEASVVRQFIDRLGIPQLNAGKISQGARAPFMLPKSIKPGRVEGWKDTLVR